MQVDDNSGPQIITIESYSSMKIEIHLENKLTCQWDFASVTLFGQKG